MNIRSVMMWWMESRSECPVCKAGISVENAIPVYGHGARHLSWSLLLAASDDDA